MADRAPHFLAGEFWQFKESPAPEGQAIDIWGLFAEGISLSEAILVQAGIAKDDIIAGIGDGALRNRFMQGSIEDVALAVRAKAQLAQIMLRAAAPKARMTLSAGRLMDQDNLEVEDEWIAKQDAHARMGIEAAAIAAADFGMTYAVLQSMARGLTKQASAGRAVPVRARNAANARHARPGAANEKRDAIRREWASGKYTSRDICAEQESGALGMSFSAARKALRNTPDPT